MIRASGGEPPAGLSAALRACLVFLVTIDKGFIRF